jgi:hypothetical protein
MIVDRLAALDERLEQHSRSSVERYEKLDKMLRGNGTPGIVTRLDRIEQICGAVRWFVGVVVAGIVTLFFKVFSMKGHE